MAFERIKDAGEGVGSFFGNGWRRFNEGRQKLGRRKDALGERIEDWRANWRYRRDVYARVATVSTIAILGAVNPPLAIGVGFFAVLPEARRSISESRSRGEGLFKGTLALGKIVGPTLLYALGPVAGVAGAALAVTHDAWQSRPDNLRRFPSRRTRR